MRFSTIHSIEYLCNNISQPPLVYIPTKRGVESIMDFLNTRKDRNAIFQLNVSGNPINFQMCNFRKIAIVHYQEWDKEFVIGSIHNYLLDFFGSSVQYHWRVDYLEHYFIPKLPNLSLCIDIYLARDFTNWQKLEAFLSSSPVFRWIGLEAALITQSFSPESKFYQAESILIIQLEHTFPFPPILCNFKGRQAIIKCDEWETSEDLIELVNRWKSGEALQKLEYLKLQLNRNEVIHQINLKEIGAKYIDATKKPPTHALPKVYDWHDFPAEPNTDPITSRTYVVRQSDNRVASILIRRKTVYFGVWNKTEEEFLKLMD
ncbi:hypothetical protein B9Z55_014855 [Caenorhabditis nigoni]|nr:hypothetical protein B9Z55_014855 [Caenorhabditis nigoni]